ncbi:MAG: hypothetical protein J6M31_04920 [Bacteroidales bacterium]|nr:hypothetical protein [Bacteroidales bacterium]
MKKVFATVLPAVLLLLGTQANAQLIPGAGYLRSTDTVKNTSSSDAPSTEAMNGFYIGASYNIPIVGVLGIAPGFYADMLFQSKDADGGSKFLNYSAASRYTEVDLNIPVNLTLKFNVGGNAAIFAYGGPVFQYAVMARTTTSGTIRLLGQNATRNDAFNHLDAENGTLNPFNIYMGGGAGFQLGDLQLVVGYDYGLLNSVNTKNYSGYEGHRGNLKVGLNIAL